MDLLPASTFLTTKLWSASDDTEMELKYLLAFLFYDLQVLVISQDSNPIFEANKGWDLKNSSRFRNQNHYFILLPTTEIFKVISQNSSLWILTGPVSQEKLDSNMHQTKKMKLQEVKA